MYRRLLSWLFLMAAMLSLVGQAMALTSATITVNGSEQSGDANVITVAFNGYVETVRYGQYSTTASVASTFGAMFSRDYLKAGLCAHAVGNVITFQLRGAATFGGVDITGSTASFTLSPSGFLSSGSKVEDTGTVTLSINGSVIASTDYDLGSTPETVADSLAESASSSLVSVTAIGTALRIDAATPGAASNNIAYSVQNAGFNSSAFSSPSFPASTISGNLQGGADAGGGSSSTVYQYSAGYDAVGNVKTLNDAVMGAWTFGYDSLNRLTSGTPGSGNAITNGLNLCWSYDSFGNRTAQAEQSGTCPTNLTPTASYNTNNQVTFVANVAPLGYSYDAAGDVAGDNVNQYLYDGDGRICAVANTPVPGMTTMTGYIYDAEGSRIAKGKITAWSCDPSINGFEPSTEHDYVLGPSGEQVTEMAASNGNMVWQHTNVWAGGKLIATYDGTGRGLHFYLDDPLGTRRSQTDYAGNWEQSCSSLPYGDALTCSDSVDGPTEHQFTSKQYDSESGNYFFEARYYNPGVGRFLSPDWSAKMEPVPYAKLDDPQSLNLYAYVRNNPLFMVDPDGHGWWKDFANGLADSTYRPIVHIAEHPIATAEGIGTAVAHPITTGKAIGTAVKDTVVAGAHGDGRAIGQIVGTVGTAVAGGAISKGIGAAGEIGGEVGGFVGETTTVTTEETYTIRLAEAQAAYPNKAGTIELHHIAPKYLGGDPKGPLVPLDGAYHQMITNEFRSLAPYGTGPVPAEQMQDIMKQVYDKYPLPSGTQQ